MRACSSDVCSSDLGSTAVGIKVLRFELAVLMTRNQFQRLYQPHGVFTISYKGQSLPEDVAKSAMRFIFIFMLSFAVLSLCLSAVGLDFIPSVRVAATALSNVGPGPCDVLGPAGSF